MCGRIGLSLKLEDVQCACAYKRNNDEPFEKPSYADEYNFGKEYQPSYNIAPTEITLVLVSAENFGQGESNERLIKPMMWGMVPKWHKDSYKNHGLSTNNCRLENILSSKLYGPPLRSGNRCVVLAEGFYEWQTTNLSKQPYYIFSPQPENTKMEDLSTFENIYDEEKGWRGINLMKMAGIYEEWVSDNEVLYSFSVITMESNSQLDWLHHRMPAVLDTGEQISNWLDPKVPHHEAVSLLKPISKLYYYPVSTLVNNSREKSPDCNKEIEIDSTKIISRKTKHAESNPIMQNWLKRSKK